MYVEVGPECFISLFMSSLFLCLVCILSLKSNARCTPPSPSSSPSPTQPRSLLSLLSHYPLSFSFSPLILFSNAPPPPLNLLFIVRGAALPAALNLTLLHKKREKETDPWEIYKTLLSRRWDLEHVFSRNGLDGKGEESTKESRPRQQACVWTNGVSELLSGSG